MEFNGEFFRNLLTGLEVDGSSLLTASQRCDGLISPYTYHY